MLAELINEALELLFIHVGNVLKGRPRLIVDFEWQYELREERPLEPRPFVRLTARNCGRRPITLESAKLETTGGDVVHERHIQPAKLEHGDKHEESFEDVGTICHSLPHARDRDGSIRMRGVFRDEFKKQYRTGWHRLEWEEELRRCGDPDTAQ